ncbi:class I SAM-dependent methyltransferase [Pseudomonas putida]|uniref:Class I SAM-dependent methyltransferase n=1 Tax=Pseudomonas putida TaxID=303 RepID=A0A6I6XPD5_PSEPU|nr:class I SAM-dependent methyltransferase [Pseudomonas putida]QHG65863.1 class I SAM-dependent methyltransferase [Pseudomonas putida]
MLATGSIQRHCPAALSSALQLLLPDWLQQRLMINGQTRVVDLGAGTGKFTRLLLPLTDRLTAVEPVDAMRQEFAKCVPGIEVLAGTAQAIPLPAASADVVLCAQAFHWFANAQALAEIHRVLTPGGRLGLVWNVRDESVDWVAAITRIISPYEGDTPRFHTGQWRTAFDGSGFSAPELTCFAHSHLGSAETVIMDRILSVSFIASLAPADKAEVTRQLRELIQTHPALRGQETIAFPYQTQAYLCQRLG